MKKMLLVTFFSTALCANDSLVKEIIGNNGPISWIADEGSHFAGVIKRDIYKFGSDCSQGWQNSCQFLKRWAPSFIRTMANCAKLGAGVGCIVVPMSPDCFEKSDFRIESVNEVKRPARMNKRSMKADEDVVGYSPSSSRFSAWKKSAQKFPILFAPYFLWKGTKGLLGQCGVELKGFVREAQGLVKDCVTLD